MIIGKLFDKYEVDFPIDNKLVIITGRNGSGKTKLLELLNEYLQKDKKEKTTYLGEYRTKDFSDDDINSLMTLLTLQEKDFDKSLFDHSIYYKKGSYIHSGQEQFINIIYHAAHCDNLLIDIPERNIDINKQINLIEYALKFNLKRLFIVTHSPSMVRGYNDKTYDVGEFLHVKNI